MRGMLPAYQGFDALDEACLQFGFRLVVQSQLLGGNCLAQISEKGQAVPTVLVMMGVVEGAALMSPFGGVHSHVCMPEKGQGVASMGGVECDANADLDLKWVPLDQK